MRLTRIIMATMVGLAVVAVPAVAGAAAPQPQPSPTVGATPPGPPQPPAYPPGTGVASLTVSDPTIYEGDTVQIIGRNFGPNEIVDIVIVRHSSQGGTTPGDDGGQGDDSGTFRLTARTNSRGGFVVSFTPPRHGDHTITGTGRTSARADSTALRVLHRHTKPPKHLPVTGSSLGTPLKVGGGLVATGMVLLLGTVLWRRRGRFGADGTH